MTRALAWILIAAVPLPAVAHAGEPEPPRAAPQPPDPPPAPAPPGTLSHQGTHRGALELGIAVVLTGAAAGLIGFGTQQFIRAQEHVEYCNNTPIVIDELGQPGIDPCMFDPPPLGFASAGLSWGFSLPLLVGAGMLFARGGRVAHDARRYNRPHISFTPWWQRRGAGAAMTLRF